MAEADWEQVTYIGKRQPKGSQLKTEKAISAAKRQGLEIDTGKKFGGGGNKQHSANKNTAVLDRETEELHHDRLSLDVAKLIQQYRQKKNLTQKELATKINEKQQVINEYEAGRAVPNNQVMGKLERVLGVKLRGKDKGQPFTQPPKK